MGNKELQQLNELRASVGLPPIEVKEYKCMVCGKIIKADYKVAHCKKCKKLLKKQGAFSSTISDHVWELCPVSVKNNSC